MRSYLKIFLFSALLFVCVCPAVLHAQPYPKVQNPANGHWYYLHLFLPVVPGGQDCLTWAEARDFAATVSYLGMQGHLATITSADEDTFVKNYLLTHLPLPTQEQERYVWIGGYQLNNQSGMNTGWRWTTGESWTYTGWNPGEPNDCCTAGETNEENCLEHHYKLDNGNPILGWNDDGCGGCRYYFLIEFEPTPKSVPTLNQYGMVVFILLIGLTYIFYLKRRQKTGA